MVNIKLPTYWSPETALAVYEFLDEIVTEISHTYSEAITQEAMETQKTCTNKTVVDNDFDDDVDF